MNTTLHGPTINEMRKISENFSSPSYESNMNYSYGIIEECCLSLGVFSSSALFLDEIHKARKIFHIL